MTLINYDPNAQYPMLNPSYDLSSGDEIVQQPMLEPAKLECDLVPTLTLAFLND